MNKYGLILEIADKINVSPIDAERLVNAILKTVSDALANGDKVHFKGFGAFSVRNRAEYIGTDPRNSRKIVVPPSKIPVFTASQQLKARIKKI